MTNSSAFRQTWLWQHAFVNPRSDCSVDDQEFFKNCFLGLRSKAELLVSRISADMPGMTVHDITHLDALWDTASIVSEGAINVNPAEAFVLGASFLLHDAGMSLAAYPNGLKDVKSTIQWKDAVARATQNTGEDEVDNISQGEPSPEVIKKVLPDVLRRLHAIQAEALATQAWKAENGEDLYLIDDAEVRFFYGPTIGQIAHSHWWSIQRVEQELSVGLGAFAPHPQSKVDRLKIACVLRIADALHLDQLRAPRFLRALTSPVGISAVHWSFQERLARPHVELDAVVFTTGQPFERSNAEAWWLAYDTLSAVNRELQDVDLLLRSRGQEVLKARQVKGAGSPEALAKTIQTKGWRPVDARLQVSDVPRIVESLGGAKLYGEDPTVALRELIQNSADAVQARRRFQRRTIDWGNITIKLAKRADGHWLSVEDTGIGMSERVLTGPLLDFGNSFWRSPMAMEEFPGLIAAGMQAIGRFGIGFFSVFMLGPVVRVISRRCDQGQEAARCLEFRGGTTTRPVLFPAEIEETPIDSGTRVEVLLKTDPRNVGGLLCTGARHQIILSLKRLVASIAPNLDVAISVEEDDRVDQISRPGDWLNISGSDLQFRLHPEIDETKPLPSTDDSKKLMRPIKGENGEIYGRAFIEPNYYFINSGGGWVTVYGLKASRMTNVSGLLLGETLTATRNTARPLATKLALSSWASEQASLIAQHESDEESQARAAEVVLECQGDIGGLKIINWGGEWLSAEEFKDRLAKSGEVAINFEGEFDYDEDIDDVHPRDFRTDFELSSSVAYVFKHDGSVVRSNPAWPSSIMDYPKSDESNVAREIKKIVHSMWGDSCYAAREKVVVGTVNYDEITRKLTVFRTEESALTRLEESLNSPDEDDDPF